jgi:uncharacterized protein
VTATPSPPAPSFRRRAWRFVRKRVPIYAGLYAAVVAVFLWFELNLVFHPHTAAEAWLPPLDKRTQDIYFTSADGTKLHAWWLPPTRPEAGAFLASHGNGGNLSYRGDLAAGLYAATGAGVLMYDYPGYGHSEGSPTEAGCYASGDAAYAWLTTEGKVPPQRVILLGESIGTGVAVDLATRHEHRALVLMCPFTSLPAAAKSHYPFLPTHTVMQSRFDSLAKIGRCPRPLLVAHSTDDRVVPFWQGEALFNAANEPKEFHRTEGAGHNLAGEEFSRVVARFLDRIEK